LSAGGFRKIAEKGSWFPDCRHLASGFSSTGLTTLATGAWPAQHGIVADSWYDAGSKSRVHASDESLLATTLLEEISRDTNSRVWVVSTDAAHGRLFAGSSDAELYWMDQNGLFQTYGAPPDWLKQFNERHSPDSHRNDRWVVPGVKPDAPPLRTLTYDAAHPEDFVALYKASPFAQETQFDLASELIARDQLGQKGLPDVLCVLSGSTELLGYETGADSRLMEQMVLHLDRRLESLLTQLGKSPGEGNFNVVLTAAHGAPYSVPDTARGRMAVDGEALAHRIDRVLSGRGLGRVDKFLYPFLYLDTSGFRDAEEIRKAAGRAALDLPAVADYFTAGGASSAQDEWQRRFRNSFHPRRSGDVMLAYHPEFVEEFGPKRGISYGSIYNYDARVPLGMYGPAFRPGVYERMVESVDVAPTLARVLGVGLPSSATGRVLSEAMA
jgi:Type I phosphodiesterase / nucleotide pyrophosphatase